MVLTLKTTKKPALTITRTATKANELVYVAVANRKIKYTTGQSRIVYIGTTKVGARRIAASAAAKANDMLKIRGVQHLELFVVTCKSVPHVKTWHKLERGLILAFREIFGSPPIRNKTGQKMRWTDELTYFTRSRLDTVVRKYSH